MKHTACIALLALCGCASVPQGVQMTADETKACAAQGCSVWTEAELRELIAKVAIDARATALGNLDSHGCLRGKT